MSNHVRRGLEIIGEDGVSALANRALWKYFPLGFDAYWEWRGARTLRARNTTATFGTGGRSSYSLELFTVAERDLLADMLDEAEPDDVLWDIGANIGFHSAFVGQRVDHTVAFEPVPPIAEMLRENLHRNGVESDVRTHALGDTDGELALTNDSTEWIPPGETVSRQVRTGDSVGEGDEVPPPTMLKIDVEGAEGNVLAGLEDSLPDCRVAYLELHNPGGGSTSVEDFGYTMDAVYEQLRGAGFEIETLTERGSETHVKAAR